ncbi:MAG: calycin-like domain-containing protein [Bacteroidaceae bacterium]
MKVWIKYSGVKLGSATVYLLTKGYYQDPMGNTGSITASCVAKAARTDLPSNDTWTEYTLPFNYSEDVNENPVYAFVNFSTCNEPGNGATSDYMLIDDIEMVYNSELTGAKYNGENLIFENGHANVSAIYEPNKLTDLTSNGQGASIDTVYDEETALLTIIVSGNNISEDSENKHVYTIQFAKPDDIQSAKFYNENLYVTINGGTNGPQEATVEVQTRYDGKINFLLKNFILYAGEDIMPVGNIMITGLALSAEGQYKSFSFDGETAIAPGDEGFQLEVEGELYTLSEEDWAGPGLGMIPMVLSGKMADDKLRVSIDINMTTLGQVIVVHLGYDAASLAVKSAAQYGTFCAPFDVTIPEGVTAYTISSIGENGKLALTEVQSTIPAHTPVIVYSESTADINAVQFGVATAGEPVTSYLTGVYTATQAPVGSYVLQKQGERVGFYQVQESSRPTVGANRAYLTTSSAGVKAFYMEDATAIQAVEELLGGKADIYDLAGRRLQKLQKGINIVGGKKVLVK